MITVDTVKCAIPPQYIKTVNMQVIEEECIIKSVQATKVKNITIKKKDLPIGLHTIDIQLFREEIIKVTMEFSAKVLYSDYTKLISKNTIEETEYNINHNHYIQFKPYWSLNAEVFRVDLVNDLNLNDPIKGIQALSLLRGNKDYSVRMWGKDESIYFLRDAKTIKETLKFYRKGVELARSKNKALLKYLSKADIEYFKRVLRVEQTISRPSKIKKTFSIQDNLFSNVLLSESQPNYILYKKIKGGITFMTDITKAANLKEVFWIALITNCKYDVNRIEAILKSHTGKNLYRKRKEYRPILKRLISKNLNDSGYTEILNDIENQLSA